MPRLLAPFVVLVATLVSLADAERVLVPVTHGPERGYQGCVVSDLTVGDVDITARLRRSPGIGHYGLVFRYQDDDNLYRLVLRTSQRDFRVEKLIRGASDYAATRYVQFPSRAWQWYTVRLRCEGARVQVWIDDALLYERDGFSELVSGKVGVTVYDSARAECGDFRISDAKAGELLYGTDFENGLFDAWLVTGAEGVKGEWAVQEAASDRPPQMDFETLYGFHAAPAAGPTRTMNEFASLLRTRDGRLLTTFIEENQHGTPPWAAMPASGRLWYAWSEDAGRTWSPQRPFIDTPVDDRHCYVTELPNGSLLATFWVQLVAFGTPGILNYATVSDDGGATWGDPVRWRSPNGFWDTGGAPVPGSSSVTVPARVHPDGRLYLAIHTAREDGPGATEIGLLWSRDGGRTWGDYARIAADPAKSVGFVEPAVIRTREGRWIAVTRTEVPITPGTTHPYKLGPTMWCTSEDGLNWTAPEPMPLGFTDTGSTAPFLVETSAGAVVFAVNTGTAFSYDAGRTWVSQELQCGYYPVLEEIAPNTVASLACGMGGNVFRLTQPAPGEAPQPAARPAPVPRPPASLPRIAAPVVVEEVLERPRVIRLRGALVGGRSGLVMPELWPTYAVFPARLPDGYAVAAVISDGEGKAWSDALVVRRTATEPRGIAVAAGPDGGVVVTYSVGEPSEAFLVRSRDGIAFSEPVALEAGEGTGVATSAPAVDTGAAGLVIPVTVTSADGVSRVGCCTVAADGMATRVAGGLPAGLVEPALAIARDGRWILLARQEPGRELVQSVSTDAGATWSPAVATPLRGSRPVLTELLETFFVAGFEGENGQLRGGLSWDGLEHWLSQPIACGHLVRVAGRKHVGLGCGEDLAGAYNRLEQVPLDTEEVQVAESAPARIIPATDPAVEAGEAWTTVELDGQTYLRTTGRGEIKARFSGTGVSLTYGRQPDGHILQVLIDGVEYPPVETRGPAAQPVRQCIATGLAPGDHVLTVRQLMYWQSGSITFGGLSVIGESQ